MEEVAATYIEAAGNWTKVANITIMEEEISTARDPAARTTAGAENEVPKARTILGTNITTLTIRRHTVTTPKTITAHRKTDQKILVLETAVRNEVQKNLTDTAPTQNDQNPGMLRHHPQTTPTIKKVL